MSFMCRQAKKFNQDISNWNTSKVGSYMNYIFDVDDSFNQDISKWDNFF